MRIHFFGKYSFSIAMIICLSAFFAWQVNSQSKPESSELPLVKIKTAEITDSESELDISGFVRGEKSAEVSPMVNGKILNILKYEGAFVNKGEVVAIIDSEQTDAQIKAARDNISALEKNLEYTKNYYEQLVKQADKERDADPSDAADAAVKSAKKARDLQIQAVKNQIVNARGFLDITQSGRKNFNLTAPFSGTIIGVHKKIGEFSTSSIPLFSIATEKKFELETYVPATDGKLLSLGYKATIFSKSGDSIKSTVTALSPSTDTRNFKTFIRIRLEETTADIALGDFLRGKIFIPREKETFAIPRQAIIVRGGELIFFTIDENKFAHAKKLENYEENGDFFEIENGISGGEKIVIEGQQNLTDNIQVKIYASQ